MAAGPDRYRSITHTYVLVYNYVIVLRNSWLNITVIPTLHWTKNSRPTFLWKGKLVKLININHGQFRFRSSPNFLLKPTFSWQTNNLCGGLKNWDHSVVLRKSQIKRLKVNCNVRYLSFQFAVIRGQVVCPWMFNNVVYTSLTKIFM